MTVTLSDFDEELISPFVHAATQTMRVQFHLEATPGQPFPKGSQTEPILCIAALMSLNSNFYVGTIAVGFPRKVFLAMMGNMLRKEYKEIDNAIEDGAAEFLNITYGWAKSVLNHKGYGFELAIPTMVRADRLLIRHPSNSNVIVVPFETPAGPFQLEFAAKL